MRSLFTIILVILLAGTAGAREITPIKTDLQPPVVPQNAAAACVVGNDDTGAIIGYYDSWFLGYENYAVPFNAGEEGCSCADGITVTSIHMMLALDAFADFNVAVAILDAETDGAGCLSPGAEIAVSGVYNITGIPSLAYYDVSIPISAPCATAGDALFLAVYFLDDNGGELVGIPVTSGARLCFDYNDWGSGWYDVVDQLGFGGDILVWGDVECCSQPVPDEATSFGALKALFR